MNHKPDSENRLLLAWHNMFHGLYRLIKGYFRHYWWHIFVVLFIFMLEFAFFLYSPLFVDGNSYVLHFEAGGSPQSLYQALAKDKHLTSLLKLKLLFRLSPHSRNLKAGIYYVPAKQTPLGLLAQLRKGQVIQKSITIVPGMRFKELMAVLEKAPFLRRTEALQEKLAKRCGVSVSALDGALLPETYQYDAGSDEIDLLQRSCDLMTATLSDVWGKRAKGLPYKNKEALLIAASIIEKETNLPPERDKVSAVIVNRLKKGMPLQMDPTVIYALGDSYQGVIYKKHLKINNPFNTYRYRGLPPSPIAFASEGSLIAAAHPANALYYYFVATGKGGHRFSQTLKEQIKAVKSYHKSKKNKDKV
jgi:UPF0755 protein